MIYCPHCGGKSGYTRPIKYASTELSSWEGRTEAEGFEVIAQGMPVCADCKKPVGAFVRKLKKEPT